MEARLEGRENFDGVDVMFGDGLFFQVVITAWIAGHPITSTAPKIYFDEGKCEKRIEQLVKHLKPHQPHRRLKLQCAETDKRAI